jgi:hypothetical protein
MLGLKKWKNFLPIGRKNDTKDWNHDNADFFSSATVTVAFFTLFFRSLEHSGSHA